MLDCKCMLKVLQKLLKWRKYERLELKMLKYQWKKLYKQWNYFENHWFYHLVYKDRKNSLLGLVSYAILSVLDWVLTSLSSLLPYAADQESQIPEAISDLLLSGPWLPAVGEHLAASKWPQMVPQICEFLGLKKKLPISGDENVKVKIYEKNTLNVPNNLSLWRDRDFTEYLIAK